MNVGEPVPEEEVLLAFAESEALSRRWAQGFSRFLKEAEAERVRYSPRAEWSEHDRRAVLAAVRAFHPPRFEGLGKLGVTWFDALLQAADLPELGVPTTKEFRGVAPDGRLVTLVAALDKGLDTPDGEFSGWYRRLKNSFAPIRMVGRPCLVAAAPRRPYTVVEGVARLSVLLNRSGAGTPIPDQLPVYLGLSERLDAWELLPQSAGSASTPKAAGPTPTREAASDRT